MGFCGYVALNFCGYDCSADSYVGYLLLSGAEGYILMVMWNWLICTCGYVALIVTYSWLCDAEGYVLMVMWQGGYVLVVMWYWWLCTHGYVARVVMYTCLCGTCGYVTDLYLAAELGKALLERNKELENQLVVAQRQEQEQRQDIVVSRAQAGLT